MKQTVFRIKITETKRRLAMTVGLIVFLLLASFVSVVRFSPAADAATGIYKTINFQGKVVNTNGTNVADASYSFKFRIYSSASGDTATPCAATCLWEESKSLTTVNSVFQTNLGDTTTMPGAVNFNTDNLYIAVIFNGDTEMTPRIRLTSVPYAFNSDLLDGLDSSALVQLTPSGGQQSGSINVSGGITTGGTVFSNTVDSATSGALTLGATNATGLTLAKNTTLGSGLTLSLQGSNALNLGSTSAAGGIVFKDGTVNNRSITIAAVGLTASYSLNLPSTGPTAGLQCLQTASGSSTNLAFGSCGATGSFVSLQAGTPGTADTGNINISGVGIAASLYASTFDTASAVLMNIGTGNASSITIGKATVTTTVAGPLTTQDVNLAANKTVTFTAGNGNFDQSGSTGYFKTGTGAVTLSGVTTLAAGKNFSFASGAGNFDQSGSTGTFASGTGTVSLNGNTTVASGKTLVVGGDTTIKSTSATALQIQNAAGSATLFNFDTSSGNLTFGNGATRTVAIAASATAGNDLAVKAGAAGGTNQNGGNLLLSGGAGTGTGVQGLVNLATSAFASSALQTNTIAAGIVDQYSAIPVTANTTGLSINVPSPVSAVTGRILYVTAVSGSNDFTIVLGGSSISIAMKANSTATLIWNGTGWTAAGASSSTDLQSAYNNTLTSAGGAEIVLNAAGGNADGFTIRNNAATPIIGPLLEVQSSIGTNLLSVNNNAVELAANGGAETSASFATDWTAVGAATITRNTTLANVATGQASAQVVTTAAANVGIRNNLATAPAVSTQYQVSFTGKLSSGTFTTLDVEYSRDGGTTLTNCDNSLSATLITSGWSKITCTFTTPATTATNADLIIRQTDATVRTFWIDNLSVTILTTTSSPPNVQIGGGLYGGAPTLLTLDRSSTAPVGINNTALLGSMYFDTTSGRIQCYEADGWGACGSSPDNYVNIVPEYAGAVLNGSGIGTLTSDFCSNQTGVLQINSTLCGTGQALNFYRWTSPQATQQTYSIYLSYQLPAAFKQFQTDSTVQLTARTDNTTNGVVTYEMFRSEAGALTSCGTETTVTSTVNTWQTVGINGNELSGCGFSAASANNFAIFKINVKTKSNANVYVGTLSFTTTGQ